MRKLFFLCLAVALPLSIFAQIGKRLTNKTIYVATTLNYYPALKPYAFFSSFRIDDRDLILNFLTANSGTFVIEEGQSLFVERTKTNHLPSQLLGVGASLQVFNANGVFQELSLTKLSFSKANYQDEYFFTNPNGDLQYSISGYEEKAAAFAMRYEIGKYFGKTRRRGNAIRFGISGALEPSFYTYRRTAFSSAMFPVKGRIFTLDLAVIPIITTKLSKKLSLDFKCIPNILFADFGSLREENPILTEEQKKGVLEYDLPEINVAFSVLLRYQLQEHKKRRGG